TANSTASCRWSNNDTMSPFKPSRRPTSVRPCWTCSASWNRHLLSPDESFGDPLRCALFHGRRNDVGKSRCLGALKHEEVGVLAFLQRTDVLFHPQGLGAAQGRHFQYLFGGEGLPVSGAEPQGRPHLVPQREIGDQDPAVAPQAHRNFIRKN